VEAGREGGTAALARQTRLAHPADGWHFGFKIIFMKSQNICARSVQNARVVGVARYRISVASRCKLWRRNDK